MTGKKSRFCIDPSAFAGDGDGVQTPEAAADSRRLGPMASAIRESQTAAEEYRPLAEDADLAAMELGLQMKRLREAKLDLHLVPLDRIREDHLRRDRTLMDRDGLDELKTSIRHHGLSSPIRLDDIGNGAYGLNQGRRRLVAFRELLDETGDPSFAQIPALVDAPGGREAAYRRMVDENLVREDVSFAELAALAMAYAEETGVQIDDAIKTLFASASRHRRTEIGGFARILGSLGDVIRFAPAITRDLGRAIGRKLETEGGAEALRQALLTRPDRDAATETAILERASSAAKSTARLGASGPAVRKFRVQAGVGARRRYDVAVTAKRLVISGAGMDAISDDEIREFLAAATERRRDRGTR